jgi:hypothetical protein
MRTQGLLVLVMLLFPLGAALAAEPAKGSKLALRHDAWQGPDFGARLADQLSPGWSRMGESDRWEALQKARRPSRILSLSEIYLEQYPDSPRREDVRQLAIRASKTLVIQHEVGLSGDLFEVAAEDLDLDMDVSAAARGDADAAYRVTVACRAARFGPLQTQLRQEQWLRFAADLGHAQASWELAERYNLQGRVADAARYEKRASTLGYKTPPRLSTRGY